MTTGSDWQDRVGQSWAQEWQRTDRSFGALTSRLLEAAQAEPYSNALDIGCGAGELTLRLALAAPTNRHIGIDISEQLLDAAQRRICDVGNAQFVLADAASWESESRGAPDLLVSRHGVMFFADPAAAFSHIRNQSAPAARLVFSCFREREENIWAQELASVLPHQSPPSDPRAPGPFAFGDKDYVAGILSAAGWRDLEFSVVDYAMVAGSGADAVGDALSYFRAIGPAARTIAQLQGEEREAAIARLRAMVERYCEGETVALPASCWIVTARNGG